MANARAATVASTGRELTAAASARRHLRAFCVIAACLYFPFAVHLAADFGGRTPGETALAVLIWVPVLPGAFFGFFLLAAGPGIAWIAMAFATVALLGGLTSLGAASRRGLYAAALAALSISLPTAFFGVLWIVS